MNGEHDTLSVPKVKAWVRRALDPRLRDSLWALRTRRDAAVLSSVARSMSGTGFALGSDADHLRSTFAWLSAAQDAIGSGGVSAFYDLRQAVWGPAYPETTGYLIPTLLDHAQASGETEFHSRAIRMADWLLTIQLASGAFPIGPLWPDWERRPIVFDTGQVIHGLVSAFEATARSAYLQAAIRAGEWLASIQEADGSWAAHTPLGRPNSYDARTAWGLLRLDGVHPKRGLRLAAQRNLKWVLTQQTPEGWFANASFSRDGLPLTHTIAYTIEGLLESGLILGDDRMIERADRSAVALRDLYLRHGQLAARYGPGWSWQDRWTCLPGDAQVAILWLRLYDITHDAEYRQAGDRMVAQLKRTQDRGSRRSGISGGISGSHPIYAEYEPYRMLNWGAKFFADALLLRGRREDRSAPRPRDRAAVAVRHGKGSGAL
ncbi:MAG TPA: hypothetical protein VFI11_02025 [Anaerolineales bacterium]|nr:hypothetical protein [Anaerolineales bacterium]